MSKRGDIAGNGRKFDYYKPTIGRTFDYFSQGMGEHSAIIRLLFAYSPTESLQDPKRSLKNSRMCFCYHKTDPEVKPQIFATQFLNLEIKKKLCLQ